MFKQIILAAAAAVTLAALAGCATGAVSTGSSASAEQAVAAAAEKLRVAMIDPTPAALTALVADDLSWVDGRGPQVGAQPMAAKTRYRQADAPCDVTGVDAKLLQLRFPEAQWALTPGQSAVLYQGDVCLGGGVIASAD